MKRDFGWKKIFRVWRNAVRALISKRVKQTVDLKTAAGFGGRAETATNKTEEREPSGAVNRCKTKECGESEEAETALAVVDGEAEVTVSAAEKAKILKENALAKTNGEKVDGKNSQVTENNEDNGGEAARETLGNEARDAGEIIGAPSSSNENETLENKTQVECSQDVRCWKNDAGKIVVRAAFEFELSARSTEFVFLRSVCGRLYRYPLRRLSLDDRLWVKNALGVSGEDKRVKLIAELGDLSVANVEGARNAVEPETCAIAENVAPVGFGVDSVETREGARESDADIDGAEKETANAPSDVEGAFELELDGDDLRTPNDRFESCEKETLQTLDEQYVSERGKDESRLDFGEENEDEAASQNELTLEEAEAEESDDAEEDLLLNFGEDDVSSESASEETRHQESLQIDILNDLEEYVEMEERERRARQTLENDSDNKPEATRRRQEKNGGAGRKRERKRKNAKPYNAEYCEPFSHMSAETLDGLLYDYLDNYDSVDDEIETDRIIDYYDWTYGDARYRDDRDEDW